MDVNPQAKILIVDDAPENIDILQNLLQGFKLSVALNGEKALKLAFGNNKPDLILLDIMMPGIDGYEVIRRLKSDEITKGIPVIFITALSEATDETKGFALGAADYISKPFQPDVVRARVLTQLVLQANKSELMRLNAKLIENNKIIEAERKRADELLNNILPEQVIKDLKEKGSTEPMLYQNASVLFLDIVGFSKLASKIQPRKLIDELNEIFSKFDSITDIYNCERIKTIGDSYMAVCGVPEQNEKHAQLLMGAAIDFLSYIKDRNSELSEGQHKFEIRIGMNSGPLVGGIVGTKKFIYDVFGDTVNIASRMESHGEPMRIMVSENTYNLIGQTYSFEERGIVQVKNIGDMRTYFLRNKYIL